MQTMRPHMEVTGLTGVYLCVFAGGGGGSKTNEIETKEMKNIGVKVLITGGKLRAAILCSSHLRLYLFFPIVVRCLASPPVSPGLTVTLENFRFISDGTQAEVVINGLLRVLYH